MKNELGTVDDDIVIEHNLDLLGKESRNGYVAHVYCYSGECMVSFNGRDFLLPEGKCMIIVDNRFVDAVSPADDFRAVCVYLSFAYLGQCVTKSNFGIVGTVRLFSNPVLDLLPSESEICRECFEQYIARVNRPCHFRRDILSSATQLFFLEFFEFHFRIYGDDALPDSTAGIMRRFFAMLERGDYLRSREVAFYARELCVVPKYLSEICRRVSGFAASYWITRFTVQDLRNHLRNRDLTVDRIAIKFNFSSVAYLNRYVRRYLGVSANDLRE